MTGSALLDLLTAGEVAALADGLRRRGLPGPLLAVGRRPGRTQPGDPLDGELAAAFNDHQRRTIGGRRLLGPDAVAAMRPPSPDVARPSTATQPVAARVVAGAADREWLRGWVAAACEQRPELARATDDYLRRRLATCATGDLRVTVHHEDLVAVPTRGRVTPAGATLAG